ncbi:MAG: ComEC/Rec2 family competence protein, partial [bacterium]|nr:ComEC/Rec2 family competence protein [bacterium]
LPLVLYHFNILSFVSLLSNLLVVPVLPFVLALGTLFLAASFLPFLGAVLAFPAGLLLSYVAFVVEATSQFPLAAVRASGFPLWIAVLALGVPSFLALKFQQERRFRFSEQTMIL